MRVPFASMSAKLKRRSDMSDRSKEKVEHLTKHIADLQWFRLMGRLSVLDVRWIRMNPISCLGGKVETLKRNVLNWIHCLW